jgi:hypothetical protein
VEGDGPGKPAETVASAGWLVPLVSVAAEGAAGALVSVGGTEPAEVEDAPGSGVAGGVVAPVPVSVGAGGVVAPVPVSVGAGGVVAPVPASGLAGGAAVGDGAVALESVPDVDDDVSDPPDPVPPAGSTGSVEAELSVVGVEAPEPDAVEVPEPEAVAVLEAGAAGPPSGVDVTVPGAGVGAAAGPSAGPRTVGAAGCAGTEASSLSRVVGGARPR